MIEIPEAKVLSMQLNKALKNKEIKKVIANSSPHKFAWYYNDHPKKYPELLEGRKFNSAKCYGGLVELDFGETTLLCGDGVNLRYLEQDQKIQNKHQLWCEFTDGSSLIGSIQMYGGIWAYPKGEFDNPYFLVAMNKPSPLTDEFTYEYFKSIYNSCLGTTSVKAMLATEQRIPGLGNGVLQDILYHANIHSKSKLQTLTDEDLIRLYQSIKSTLKEMVDKGGRDTEKDLFGHSGGYQTKLSKHTVNTPCPQCGTKITKTNYLGGSIYTCETCQK